MNKGSVLISDLKQDLKTIKEIANDERYFKRFLNVDKIQLGNRDFYFYCYFPDFNAWNGLPEFSGKQ